MTKTAWIIFTAIIVGILGYLMLFSENKSIDISDIDINTIQSGSEQNGNIADHVYGQDNSEVTLIEYGDFECSACYYQYFKTKQVVEEYSDKITYIFRNFPLTSIHPNAKSAAAAAEAAGLQDSFWQMHDTLYENRSDWVNLSGSDRTNMFVELAVNLGLDGDQFESDMASEAVSNKLKFDQAITTSLSLNATPTFYLNGQALESDIWSDVEILKQTIETALES